MTLGRSAAVSDRGRKRRRNEDAYVCEPPLFAVADGMGGAQAGEIASRLAAAAVREGSVADVAPEQHVTALIQEANRRIYERSSADEAATGMGTTMTVALVQDREVTIGHVGDSRAYLIRGGRLQQVTDDHSLVAELVRSGKLSPEEAETHPQRSVITRVLGTEPDVDVDTFTVATDPGDLFLICSDGLTSMIDDTEILAVVEQHRDDLDAASKALVRAANRGGGEDNITIVFFEIAGAGEDTAEITGDGRPADDEDTLSELEGTPAVGVAEPAAQRPLDEADWAERLQPAPARRRFGRGAVLGLIAAAALVAIATAVALFALSRAHFVGAEKDGHVAVYQGVPWDIVGDLRLYRTVYVSPLLAAQLTRAERRRLFDHELTTEADARARITQYEREIKP